VRVVEVSMCDFPSMWVLDIWQISLYGNRPRYFINPLFYHHLGILRLNTQHSINNKKKNSRSKGGPSMNEVSIRARPYHNVHNTLGVDTGATGPRWRVDSIEWGGDREGRGIEWREKVE
jgi:hypothetical protein